MTKGKGTLNSKVGLSLQVSAPLGLTMLVHCEPQLVTPPSDIHTCMLNDEWATGLTAEDWEQSKCLSIRDA